MGIRCSLLGHKWKTVAVDSGFSTTYEGTNKKKCHTIAYRVCECCGERTFNVKGFNKSMYESYEDHHGLAQQAHRWVEGSRNIYFTSDAEIIDPSYFNSATNALVFMEQLAHNGQLKSFIKDNPTVEQAVNDLVVAIKLSDGL